MKQFDFWGDYSTKRGKSAEGLGLAAMVKSKEFKQRVALLKAGGKVGGRLAVKGSRIAFARGRIAAIAIKNYLKTKRRE